MSQSQDITLDRIPVGTAKAMGCETPVYADLTAHEWSASVNFNIGASASFNFVSDFTRPGPDAFEALKQARFDTSDMDLDIQIPGVEMKTEVPDQAHGHPGCFLVDEVTLAPSGNFQFDVDSNVEMTASVDSTTPDTQPENIIAGNIHGDFEISGKMEISGPSPEETSAQARPEDPTPDTPVPADNREPITYDISARVDVKSLDGEITQMPEALNESSSPTLNSDGNVSDAGQGPEIPPEIPDEVATMRHAMSYTLEDGAPPMPTEISALRSNMEKIMDHAAATGQTHMSVSEAIIHMNSELAFDGTTDSISSEALYAPEVFEQVLGLETDAELDLTDPEDRATLADVAAFSQHSANDILTMYYEQTRGASQESNNGFQEKFDTQVKDIDTAEVKLGL